MNKQRHNPRECWCGIDHSREARDEGNVECWNCGAVIAWEGEEPTDCLKCGETL